VFTADVFTSGFQGLFRIVRWKHQNWVISMKRECSCHLFTLHPGTFRL